MADDWRLDKGDASIKKRREREPYNQSKSISTRGKNSAINSEGMAQKFSDYFGSSHTKLPK